MMLKIRQEKTGATVPENLTPDRYDREAGKALEIVKREESCPEKHPEINYKHTPLN